MLEITETTTVMIEPVGPDRGRAGEVIVVASEKTRRVAYDAGIEHEMPANLEETGEA